MARANYKGRKNFRQTARLILRSMRPRQWLKNLSLYAPLVFWGALFRPAGFLRVTEAVVIFSLASSAIYLINDVVDAPRDRRHPYKKNRPVASLELAPSTALLAALVLLGVSLSAAYFLKLFFFLTVAAYVLLQIFYSFALRQTIILDALAIAFGFILRVFAGAWVLPVPLSSWLVLSTIGLALLLAFGKRRGEKTILRTEGLEVSTRATLANYPDSLLDAMISVSATFAIISYSLFTFQTSPLPATPLFETYLPTTSARPKLMMLTIPIVIYGVARYLYVIYEKEEGESPEKALLTDYPLLGTTILWVISVMVVIYGL